MEMEYCLNAILPNVELGWKVQGRSVASAKTDGASQMYPDLT